MTGQPSMCQLISLNPGATLISSPESLPGIRIYLQPFPFVITIKEMGSFY